jgi:HD superfamily phosphodiesterase
MNLTVIIESAESKFKPILEEFFISVFNEKTLSSHGIDHHRRVWGYSKELFNLLAPQKPDSFTHLIPKLIISSYLHDIGMSVETGIRHGKHSKDLCIRFLIKNSLPLNDFQDILDAVENHDNKEYSGDTNVNDLLKILSVADDLDAFGFTGIYRYSEIYLMRGIDLSEIGTLIKKNAANRFDNFVRSFGFNEEYVIKHKKRYKILDSFFEEYNKQVPGYNFGGSAPSGYCGVIEVFTDILNNRIELKEICRYPDMYSTDSLINWYFKELALE